MADKEYQNRHVQTSVINLLLSHEVTAKCIYETGLRVKLTCFTAVNG